MAKIRHKYSGYVCKYALVLFSLFLFFSGCVKQKPAPPTNLPLPVIVGEVVLRDIPVYVEAIGNVAASNSVDIKPQVSGKIIDVRIKGGDDVQVGDVLYRIDPLPYQLALEKAVATLLKEEAELEFARKKVERYSSLLKKNYVSQLSVEEYKRDVKSLEAQISVDKAEIGVAKNNLQYTTILSPIEGRISLQKVDVGNVVSPTDAAPLATILQISPIDINFSIAQKEFEELQPLLRQGKRQFTVILPGSQREFEGEVIGVNNQVDLRTGTIQLKGFVPNREKILWPGEFVKVRVFVKIKKQTPTIQASAVQVGQKGSYVYIVKPDLTVENVVIKTGEHVGDWVAVDEGLEPGMKVVVDGQINLYPGA